MFNYRYNIFSFFLFLFFTINVYAVDEFDINLINEKLNRLELEISDIQKTLYVPEQSTNEEEKKPISVKYQRRINKIENELAKLNGKFEEIFFRLDQLQDKLDTMSSDVDFRLSTKNNDNSEALPLSKRDMSGENDTYAYPDNKSDISTTGADTQILGTLKGTPKDAPLEVAKNFQTPDSLFDYGKDSLQNLNYSDAEIAFRGFVKKYPKNAKVPSAYFWLGESLFVRESYPEAVLAYGEVIKSFKKHEKASASLLKIGISFANLDKKKESCDALKKILKQYPDSNRDILKKTNYIIQENNC